MRVLNMYTCKEVFLLRFRGTGSKVKIQPVAHLTTDFPPVKGGGPPKTVAVCTQGWSHAYSTRSPTLEKKSAAPGFAYNGKLR